MTTRMVRRRRRREGLKQKEMEGREGEGFLEGHR
jgi:hypothetical protein